MGQGNHLADKFEELWSFFRARKATSEASDTKLSTLLFRASRAEILQTVHDCRTESPQAIEEGQRRLFATLSLMLVIVRENLPKLPPEPEPWTLELVAHLDRAIAIAKTNDLSQLDEPCDALIFYTEMLDETKDSVKTNRPNPTTSSAETPHRVRAFLCHSTPDKKEVTRTYRRLQDDGFHPWLDKQNLIPGQNWRTEISKAIRESNAVIVFLSRASVNRAGFVQAEIKQALDVADEQPEGSVFVIPALLEPCTVPDRLRHLHWVELYAHDGYDRLVNALKLKDGKF